jgi:hypothetical protein
MALSLRLLADPRLRADARAGQNWRGAVSMRLIRLGVKPPKWRIAGVFTDCRPALRRTVQLPGQAHAGSHRVVIRATGETPPRHGRFGGAIDMLGGVVARLASVSHMK